VADFSFSEFETNLIDMEGRPLMESKAPAQAWKEGVPHELQVCEHAGSRFKHENPMNVSALKQMSRHFHAAVECLADLRHAYSARVQPVQTFLDIFRMAEACALLPAYLALQRQDASQNALLPEIAVLAKMGFGIQVLARELSLRSIIESEREQLPPIDARSIFEYAERESFLIGPKEVCAGPTQFIIHVLDLIIRGEDSQATRPLQNDRWGRMAPAAIDFALASIDRFLIRCLFLLSRCCLQQDLSAHLAKLLAQDSPAMASLRSAFDRLPELDESSMAKRIRTSSPVVDAIAEALPASSPQERIADLHEFLKRLSSPSNDATGARTLEAARRMINACNPARVESAGRLAALMETAIGPVALEERLPIANFIASYLRLEHWYMQALSGIEQRFRIYLSRTPVNSALDWETLAQLDDIQARTYIRDVFGLHSRAGENLLLYNERGEIRFENMEPDDLPIMPAA